MRVRLRVSVRMRVRGKKPCCIPRLLSFPSFLLALAFWLLLSFLSPFAPCTRRVGSVGEDAAGKQVNQGNLYPLVGHLFSALFILLDLLLQLFRTS